MIKMLNQKILVSVEDLQKIYGRKNYHKYLDWLRFRKIFPILASPELAQLCGHLMGDGYLRITKKTGGGIKFYGTKGKLEHISSIYNLLFHKRIAIVYENKYPRLETTDSVVARCFSLINIPDGEKVMKSFSVPKWILHGSKEIKRRFLQALIDDELEGIYKDKIQTNSWKGLRLRMNKNEEFLADGLKFFNQLKTLLKEFDIETTEAKVYQPVSFIRKDGTKNYRIVFRIKNNIANRRIFYREIGFIYDIRRQKKLTESIHV